jgi:hypothetical protein
MPRNQQNTLRRSQAIAPYGPGAILDHGPQCFVVLDTSGELNGGWQKASTITLPRLQRILVQQDLGGRDGFRLPPTREDGRYAAITVQRFPQWLFCPRCRMMCKWGQKMESRNQGNIPTCQEPDCRQHATILVPMRFLAICEKGHLSDIDWFRWAHSNPGKTINCDRTNPRLKFMSQTGQASLNLLSVECAKRDCGAKNSLGGLLSDEGLKSVGQRCWGRQPWQPWEEDGVPCEESLKARLRSEASVHHPHVVSALDIRTGEVISDERSTIIRDIIHGYEREMHLQIEDQWDRANYIAGTASEVLKSDYPEQLDITVAEVHDVMDNIKAERDSSANEEPTAPGDLFEDEWTVLTHETPASLSHDLNWIKVQEEQIPPSSPLANFIDGVFLIDRLREVRVFAGFRRGTSDPDKDLTHPDLGETAPTWLPGIEVFGEGVFIRFKEEKLRDWESDQTQNLDTRIGGLQERLREPDGFTRRFASRTESLARFLLLHTFSHVFIRQLQYECGYSSASLRERLYVYPDKAGVLIYTADADSEGSLGGLVRQGNINRLQSTVQAAMGRSAWCSNDPVCSELAAHGPGRTNRAACHACALVAETSCTEMNGLLDRMLLTGQGSSESGLVGYFKELL